MKLCWFSERAMGIVLLDKTKARNNLLSWSLHFDATGFEAYNLISKRNNALLVGNYHYRAAELCVHFFKYLYKVAEAPQVDSRLGLVKNSKLGRAGKHGYLESFEEYPKILQVPSRLYPAKRRTLLPQRFFFPFR